MRKARAFSVISLFSALLASQAQSTQTAVTLWQFSSPRLLGGQLTLPLQPIGTASDGVATTYLYQVLNPAEFITTEEGGFVTKTIPSATPRTIAASASGWVELFGTTQAIRCGLVDSTFGQCVNVNTTTTSLANSGAPTPVVIPISAISTQISSSSALATLSSRLNFLPSPSPTASGTNNSASPARKLAVGAIVGGIVGALLLIIGILVALWWCRRRRLRHMTHEPSAEPYRTANINGYNNSPESESWQVALASSSATTSHYPPVSAKRGRTSTSTGTSSPLSVSMSEFAWDLDTSPWDGRPGIKN